jgi:hypothetical protein
MEGLVCIDHAIIVGAVCYPNVNGSRRSDQTATYGEADSSADADASADPSADAEGDADSDADASADGSAEPLGSGVAVADGVGASVGSGKNRDGTPRNESRKIRTKIANTVRIQGAASRSPRGRRAPR